MDRMSDNDVHLTPHKFSLLIIIKYYLKVQDPFAKHQLGHFLMQQLTKSFPELLQALGNLAHGAMARDHLAEKVRRLVTQGSVDSIFDFFTKLKTIIPPDDPNVSAETPTFVGMSTKAFKHSPIILFVRKLLLRFNMILFDSLCRLWDELEHYYYEEMHGILSPYESVKFVNQELKLIEKSIGVLPRAHIEERIEHLKDLAPNLAQAHFLSYLSYLHHGEFEKAVDDLHRYFDYSTQAMAPAPLGNAAAPSLLPYASLNLAGLHFRFGHVSEAINLIHETEVGDEQCLTLALSWLCRLVSNDQSGTHLNQEFQLLHRVVGRSQEMPDLLYTTGQSLLGLAHHSLLHPKAKDGESPSTNSKSDIHELIRKSAMKGRITDNLSSFDLESMCKLMSVSYILKMQCWSIFGNKDKPRLYAQIQLESYGKKGEGADGNLALLRLAFEYSSMGEYDKSLKLLQEAKRYFALPPTQHTWHLVAYQILHEWALRRSQLAIAAYLGVQLQALCSSPVTDMHTCVDTKYRHIRLLIKQKSYSEAAIELDKLVEQCESSGFQIYIASLYTLRAEIELELESYSTALHYCTLSIELSEKHQLKNIMILLAEIQLEMDFPANQLKASLETLNSSIFNDCDNETVIKSLLLQAKMALSEGLLEQALDSLKEGEELALRMQQIDQIIVIYYLKMRAFYHLEKEQERDEAFKQLEAHESKRAIAINQQLTDSVSGESNLESDLFYLSLLNSS